MYRGKDLDSSLIIAFGDFDSEIVEQDERMWAE